MTNNCRHCGKPLLTENATMADGCPCNSRRGINHGMVDVATCTCDLCDPAGTGGSRFTVPKIESLHELGEGNYVVYGTCACGAGAGIEMQWACTMQDGSVVPRCGKCARQDQTGRYVRIDKDTFDYFTALHVMTA